MSRHIHQGCFISDCNKPGNGGGKEKGLSWEERGGGDRAYANGY